MSQRYFHVRGLCIMCGEEALQYDSKIKEVVCSDPACPRPSGVTELLLDSRQSKHLVELGETDFLVAHPISERMDGGLMGCRLNEWLKDQPAPPADPGTYHARPGLVDAWIFTPTDLTF